MTQFCYILGMNFSKIIQLALYGAILGYELPRMVHRLKSDESMPCNADINIPVGLTEMEPSLVPGGKILT